MQPPDAKKRNVFGAHEGAADITAYPNIHRRHPAGKYDTPRGDQRDSRRWIGTDRYVIVQCDRCGCTGSAELDRHGIVASSIPVAPNDDVTTAERAWLAAEAVADESGDRDDRRIAERLRRDYITTRSTAARTLHHHGCGGRLVGYRGGAA